MMLNPLGLTHGLEQQSFPRGLLVKAEAWRVWKQSKPRRGRDSAGRPWGLVEFWGSDLTRQASPWNRDLLCVGDFCAVKLK